jgi:hypothetical protein
MVFFLMNFLRQSGSSPFLIFLRVFIKNQVSLVSDDLQFQKINSELAMLLGI